jgi:acetylornithine deacetylase/succinyl-diaminopimelate desuccinylase-like protein
VNVRFCCDGEEEIGGSAIVEYLGAHAGSPAVCVIFDTPMLDADTPVFTIGTRGTLYLHLEVHTGSRDLHSGVYGGAALNALHVLVKALDRLLATEGQVSETLMAGVVPPSPEEVASWGELPSGRDLLAEQGAAEADTEAARDFYTRTWALPSLDINGIEGGSANQQKTIVVSEARANLSMRLAHGQQIDTMFGIIDEQIRNGLPASARVELTLLSACRAGQVDPTTPALAVARSAFERALGKKPLMLRSGGSLPLVPLLEHLQIPTVVTGFAPPDANMHAPNERMRLSDLAAAIAAARATFTAFALQ